MIKLSERFDFNVILILASIVVCAGILIYSIWAFYKFLLKLMFSKKYGIGRLPRSIKIKRLKNGEKQRNHFVLKYPYWENSKKDGTADRRIKNNVIIWRNSKLYIDMLMLTSLDPCDILYVVRELRSTGIDIDLCKEERSKYNKIYKRKEAFTHNGSIQDIINYYEEKPTDFERLCAELFNRMGYESKVTPKTNDGGYDILLSQNSQRTIVECKCYSMKYKIGRPAVQKLVGANSTILADRMIFITTSNFSENAVIYANETDVELINGCKLLELLTKYDFLEQQEIEVDMSECQLEVSDMRSYIPKDIYRRYFC